MDKDKGKGVVVHPCTRNAAGETENGDAQVKAAQRLEEFGGLRSSGSRSTRIAEPNRTKSELSKRKKKQRFASVGDRALVGPVGDVGNDARGSNQLHPDDIDGLIHGYGRKHDVQYAEFSINKFRWSGGVAMVHWEQEICS